FVGDGGEDIVGTGSHVGEPVDGGAGQGRRRLAAEAQAVRSLPRACRARRVVEERRQAIAGDAAIGAGGGRDFDLRPGSRPAWAAPRALGLYRRGAARAPPPPLLSRARGSLEA